MDYEKERNKYRPKQIRILLIGEAPPPNGQSFFYVPRGMSNKKPIEEDTNLPATIFYHYFKKRPENIIEYENFLIKLKELGIFLIDIIDEPIRVRKNKENERYLISRIPDLKNKIKAMDIDTPQENWIFLLARNSYVTHIQREYPNAQRIRWKDFRLNK